MSEKKHIDRLFQEKFKDFEVSPREKIWKNIARELKKNNSRKPVPLWYKLAGAAAVAALLFLAGNSIFNNPAPEMADTDKKEKIDQVDPSETFNKGTGIVTTEENKTSSNSEKKQDLKRSTGSKFNKPQLANTKKPSKTSDVVESSSTENISHKNQVSKNSGGIASGFENPEKMVAKRKNRVEQKSFKETKSSYPHKTPVVVSAKNPSGKSANKNEVKETPVEKEKSLIEVAEAIEEKKDQSEKEREKSIAENKNYWQVSPFAGPVYYGGFGDGNTLDPALSQNESQSEVTAAYGINVAYRISEKITVRSGIGQVNMSQNTGNIAFVPSVEPTALKNVNYSPQSEMLSIRSSKSLPHSDGEFAGRGIPYNEGTLNQRMGYIEIPLEVEYALVDKKFGLSLIGGASTLFLNENNISIHSAEGTTNIGKASNLNKTSFSTNIGLGLDYDISKQFEVSLEPTFKYQLNTFNEEVRFNPYYFGVYTGIRFKF